ncbi:hypothetical protein EYF80_042276 [Liparis tanakae]|uniref:Uncharacterized protein n=1 Tax=Liparis tanakae TaxID=230148 RepID=A0A4Z2G3E4_9TELE|nr:hypothetical protein EYF80_042276 [Liparis tanakae]
MGSFIRPPGERELRPPDGHSRHPSLLRPRRKASGTRSLEPGPHGLQALQAKEPSVLVHTARGHAPGRWHSSTSTTQGKEKRAKDAYQSGIFLLGRVHASVQQHAAARVTSRGGARDPGAFKHSWPGHLFATEHSSTSGHRGHIGARITIPGFK